MRDLMTDDIGTGFPQPDAQSLAATARFARHIVHDLNNILGTALGNLELARATLDGTAEGSGYLAKVEKALGRAAALTDELLLFASERPARLVSLRPSAAVQGLKERIAALLPRGAALDIAVSDDDCEVEADPDEFEAAVLRLVENACDAMGEAGRLRIGSRRQPLGSRDLPAGQRLPPGSYAAIAVTDNGAGIAEESRARAFEPFFSTKRRRDRRGLGLSAVYGFAARHHGGVDIAPVPGGGTCAVIYLPCK